MKRIQRLTFFIHGFVYAQKAEASPSGQVDERVQATIDRESACARGWSSRLRELSEEEALVIIPAGREGPAADFYTDAAATLGDRCFLLDVPDCLSPEFWTGAGHDRCRSLLGEIQNAFVHQQMAWNKEELQTALHARGCCRQLTEMLGRRDASFDPATVTAEAWGASFDGCVTKYTLYLRRMLGLVSVIEIDFDLTVPDAAFLLSASLVERILLGNGLRLFLFELDERVVALYTLTEHSTADPPAYVTLTVGADMVTVKSKQAIRLWPQPEAYVLQDVPSGFHEPPQVVVTRSADGLRIPVSAGLVYRLAKAPAYIFMPRDVSYADARSMLRSAKIGWAGPPDHHGI